MSIAKELSFPEGLAAITAFTQALGIADHPGLRVSPGQEGYKNYTFGCRAGPCKPNVCDLAHELAHAVQFGPRYFEYRAKPHGFVFKERWIWIGPHRCNEPRTAQATIRELDTFAYQAHLLELAGIEVEHDAFFNYAGDLVVTWMTDWFWIPGENKEERIAWCTAKAKHFYAKRKPKTIQRRLTQWLTLTQQKLADLEQTG